MGFLLWRAYIFNAVETLSTNVPIAKLDSVSSGAGWSACSSFAKTTLSARDDMNGVNPSTDSVAISTGARHWIGRPRGSPGGRAATVGYIDGRKRLQRASLAFARLSMNRNDDGSASFGWKDE
jgi:hypothetical protein